jgi:aryl-alcohol dehydrogenase-like predicted oxidoreductase
MNGFDPYAVVPLNQTGLRFTRLGLGTGTHGTMHGSDQLRMGAEAFQRLVRDAYGRGIRWFDTADLYGTGPATGEALRGIDRDTYCLVSKVWWRQGDMPGTERPDADVAVGRFLKELRTDYLDLVLLHCLTSGNWPEELRRQMDLLAGMKDRGVIRAHGVSVHTVEALAAAADEPWVDSVHVRLNHAGVCTDGPMEQVVPLVRKVHAAGKGVIAMKVIGNGQFTDAAQREASVRFVLGLDCVDAISVGFMNVEQMDEIARTVRETPRVPGGEGRSLRS